MLYYFPLTQTWKVNALNQTDYTKLELNNQGPFKSPGKWNISSVSNDKIKLAKVTRALDLDKNSKIGGEYYIHNSITILETKNINLIYIVYYTTFVIESTSDVGTSKSTNLSFNVNANTFMSSHGNPKLN
jgi:hypothetical protein